MKKRSVLRVGEAKLREILLTTCVFSKCEAHLFADIKGLTLKREKVRH